MALRHNNQVPTTHFVVPTSPVIVDTHYSVENNMSIDSAAMTHWLASVRWTSGNSTARGDNLFGSGNYTSDGSCPNGLTWLNHEGCRAARKAQIDRARKYIEEWNADIAAAALVAEFDAAAVQQVISQVWSEVYDGTSIERSG